MGGGGQTVNTTLDKVPAGSNVPNFSYNHFVTGGDKPVFLFPLIQGFSAINA
jgi:hypothetical protein